jgi:hypothetical protein
MSQKYRLCLTKRSEMGCIRKAQGLTVSTFVHTHWDLVLTRSSYLNPIDIEPKVTYALLYGS